ncbi:MAG: hypothetical protein ACQERI_01705, partial [Candidatus Krumholzibacteriota bacterium]
PARSPINLEIWLFGTNPRRSPINIMIMKTIGRMRRSDLTAIFRDFLLFSLFLRKEINKHAKAKRFISKAVGLIILNPHPEPLNTRPDERLFKSVEVVPGLFIWAVGTQNYSNR